MAVKLRVRFNSICEIDMIHGKHIRLSPLAANNLELTREWANDRELNACILRALPVTEYDQNQWYDSLCRDRSRIVFAAYGVDNNEHIGNCGFYHIDYLHRRAEFWTLIGDKACWGKGYSKEIVRLMVDYGFETLNLNRIYLNVRLDHQPAVRLYETTGFQREGILKEQYYLQGEYVDVLVMAVLKKDYHVEE